MNAYPDPKDSWAVVMVAGGTWVAVKRPSGILTEDAATQKAATKNAARRRQFARSSPETETTAV